MLKGPSGPLQHQVSKSGAGALSLSPMKALPFESQGMGLLHFMLKVMELSLFRPRALEKFLEADGCSFLKNSGEEDAICVHFSEPSDFWQTA